MSYGVRLPYDIKTGHDGKRYIVFANSCEREQYNKRNPGDFDLLPVSSFGNFENAHCLDPQYGHERMRKGAV